MLLWHFTIRAFPWLKEKICKTSPKTLLSRQSISEFLEHSSHTERERAGGEWIIPDYLSRTWEATTEGAAMINLPKVQGNLQRLFCGEIETPFARSLPGKGVLNQRSLDVKILSGLPKGLGVLIGLTTVRVFIEWPDLTGIPVQISLAGM